MTRSRSRSAIENVDVAAATFVVGADLQIADFATIDEALLNLPSQGGTLFCLEGTFTASTTITLPSKDVVIVGSGFDVTTLSMPSFAGPLFQTPDGLTDFIQYEIDNLSAEGGSVAGQSFFAFNDAGGYANAFLNHVRISGFETISNWLKYDLTYFRQSTFFVSNSMLSSIVGGSNIAKTPNPANSYLAAVSFRAFETIFTTDFTNDRWTGDADCDLWMDHCRIGPTFLSGAKFNGIGFTATSMSIDGTGDVTFYGNGWDNNDFQDSACIVTSATDTGSRLVLASVAHLVGTQFFSVGLKILFVGHLYEIRTAGSLGANPGIEIAPPNDQRTSFISGIIGQQGNAGSLIKLTNAFGTRINCNFVSALAGQKTVEETGTTDSTQIFGCVGLNGGDGPTIIGPNTRVEGATVYDKAASSTNALVTIVPTIVNPKGLQGVGTVKNTDGANSIDVKESFTDAFGTTSTLTSTVTAGNSLPLSLAINIGTGFPDYVSYKVEVIDTVAGNHATYVSHFTAQGVV